MQLYEWESKRMLAKYDVPVPRGWLWSTGQREWWDRGCVVKAQTLSGGRGLQGGVAVCDGREEASVVAQRLLGSSIADERIDDLYVEEYVATTAELYAGIIVDREAGTPRLLLGAQGGVDVETSGGVVGMPVPLDVGPRSFHIRELVRRAGVPGADPKGLIALFGSLWKAFLAEDAQLIEVNPLAVTAAGEVIALDAKIILDDGATIRHPEWPAGGSLGTSFERRCRSLGAVGIELDGGIAAIVSGAGLMMATVDLLVSSGGRVGAAVDLGGLVLREASELADLIGAVAALHPESVLINAYFQLATCDALARGLAAGLDRTPLECPIILRLRGRNLEAARAILDGYQIHFEPDLASACRFAGSVTSRLGRA